MNRKDKFIPKKVEKKKKIKKLALQNCKDKKDTLKTKSNLHQTYGKSSSGLNHKATSLAPFSGQSEP
jgi:hypothetical protein